MFAGKIGGVHKQIQTSSAHAIYIHRPFHRLQLTLIQAAASIKELRMFLGPWPVFGSCFIIPLKTTTTTDALMGIQAVLGFPELKILKPK